jgi:hypothetical protein
MQMPDQAQTLAKRLRVGESRTDYASVGDGLVFLAFLLLAFAIVGGVLVLVL